MLIMLVMSAQSTAMPRPACFGAGIRGVFTIVPLAWANYFGRDSFEAISGPTLTMHVTAQALGAAAVPLPARHDWRLLGVARLFGGSLGFGFSWRRSPARRCRAPASCGASGVTKLVSRKGRSHG
jgi:hypothetical protein